MSKIQTLQYEFTVRWEKNFNKGDLKNKIMKESREKTEKYQEYRVW